MPNFSIQAEYRMMNHVSLSLYSLPPPPPEFISPQLCPPTLLDFNPVDNSMWEILPEQLYKIRITDLKL